MLRIVPRARQVYLRISTLTSLSTSRVTLDNDIQPSSDSQSARPADSNPQTANPVFIPERHQFRTLVLCFDGTGDEFDEDDSNVVTFFSMLKKNDRSRQLCYYQAGLGTYTTSLINTSSVSRISRALDMMFAWNLRSHVLDGYKFLMENHTEGDRICLFGFSRGAYIARALAAMIQKVGLLPPSNYQQVPFAYSIFERADEPSWKQSNLFKKSFSIDVNIEFIGVWDTVSSVGMWTRTLPYTARNPAVRIVRHAIALDERRAKFKPNFWREQAFEIAPNQPESNRGGVGEQRKSRQPSKKPQDVEQVWFAGCHCDVGGGSVARGTAHTLARIPLRWMIRECFKVGTGITFYSERLQKIGLDPDTLYPIVLTRPPALSGSGMKIRQQPPADPPERQIILDQTEEEAELHDALSPHHDQLDIAPFWWMLEHLPLQRKYQAGDGSWILVQKRNRGGPRHIPNEQKTKGPRIHRSVKIRMEAEYEGQPGVKYRPRADFYDTVCNYSAEDVVWVD